MHVRDVAGPVITVGSIDPNVYVRDLQTSMNDKDPEPYMRHYAQNATLTDPSTPAPVRGKDGIRKNWEQWSTAFGEVEGTVRHSVQNANKIAFLFDFRGRHAGELEVAPGERIPATNKPVKMEIACFFTLDETGKIVSDNTVFDLAALMQQLGLLPGASATASTQGVRQVGTPARR